MRFEHKLNLLVVLLLILGFCLLSASRKKLPVNQFLLRYPPASQPYINNSQFLDLAEFMRKPGGVELAFRSNGNGKKPTGWAKYRISFEKPIAYSLDRLPEGLELGHTYRRLVARELADEPLYSLHASEEGTSIRACYLKLDGDTATSCLGYSGYRILCTKDGHPNYAIRYEWEDIEFDTPLELKHCVLTTDPAGERLYFHSTAPYLLLTDTAEEDWGFRNSWEERLWQMDDYTCFAIIENPAYSYPELGLTAFTPPLIMPEAIQPDPRR
ncbi:hypothetical protein KDL44_16150 [bacterium]|nr:hypothetical protein [bacterium]